MKQRVIAILGMHRSGTSMLTGTLEQAGLYLGKVNESSVNNEKGSRESNFLMQFHDAILKDNKSTWNQPPYKTTWLANKRTIRDFYIYGFRDQPIWGFKDPRSLFVINGWKEALPNLEFVGIFRHPSLVAQSLVKRNGFTFQQGIDLWVRYNRKLVAEYRNSKFPIIEFVNDSVEMKSSLASLVKALKLKDDIEINFLSEDLVHHKEVNEIKWEAMKLYKILQGIKL